MRRIYIARQGVLHWGCPDMNGGGVYYIGTSCILALAFKFMQGGKWFTLHLNTYADFIQRKPTASVLELD
jgi:hypothetical protein